MIQLLNNDSFIKKIDDLKKEIFPEQDNLIIKKQPIPDLERQIKLPKDLDKKIKIKSILELVKLFKNKEEIGINFYNDCIYKKFFDTKIIEEKILSILNNVINHFKEFKSYKTRIIGINLSPEDFTKLNSLFNKYEKIYEKSIDQLSEEIKNLIYLLKEAVEYLNNLSNSIIEQKKHFENSFNDLNIIEEDKLRCSIYSSYSSFIECVEKYNEYLNQIKKIISKNISFKKLELIQKKINDMIKSKKINIPELNNKNSLEGINLFKQLRDNKYIDNLYIQDLCINQMKLNILFIFDITSSMGEYIESFRNNFDAIKKQLKQKCPLSLLYLGFIGYKDIQDLELGDEYIDIDFTLFYDEIYNKIKNIQAEGGDDIPEDVAGAFQMALNKSWSKGTNIIFLITDSPCHGTKYHDLDQKVEIYKDKFPKEEYNSNDEELKREKIEKLVEEFVNRDFNLICLDIHENTKKMFKMFEDKYGQKNKNNMFNVIKEEKKEKEVLVKCIIQKVSELYTKKEEEIIENLKK